MPLQATCESYSLRVSPIDWRCLMCCAPWLFFRCRPENALIFFRDRPQPFVNEFLHALPAIGLGHVDVAFRVRSNAVRAVEFAGLASPLAECRQNFEGIAQEDVDAVVLAIRQVDVFLLRVLREGDVPRRAGTQRALRDECLLHKGPVWLEHLDAVIHAVTDV